MRREAVHAQRGACSPLAPPLSFLAACLLESRSHGSLLCEFLGVQGFSEGRGLIGVGGHYGGAVGDGVRRSPGVAGGGVQVLPGEQVCVAAG